MHFSSGDAIEMISRPRAAHDRDGAVEFFVREVHDVLPEDHAQFGAGHADFGHGTDGDLDVGRELVGDGGDAKELTWKLIIIARSAKIALMPQLATLG